MAAITSALKRIYKGVPQATLPYKMAASVTIPEGAFVALDGSKWADNAADTSGFKVVGMAAETKTNGSTAGATEILVDSGVVVRVPATGVTQAHVGTIMWLVNNNEVDNSNPGNSVLAGVMVRLVSSTEIDLWIPVGGLAAYAQS